MSPFENRLFFVNSKAILSLVIQKAVAGLAIATTLVTAAPATQTPAELNTLFEADSAAAVVAALPSQKVSFTVMPLPAPEECTTKECVKETIVHYAARFGVSSKLALAVAQCESNFRTNVYGDQGLAYGVFQFHRGTFDLFAREFFPNESLDYYSAEDSIKLATVSLASGKGSHWTCYRKVTAK